MTDDIVAILRSERNNCRCNAYYSGECCCDAKWAEDYVERAADEIERLRAQVADLLPFAVADAELGVGVGPHPDGDYDECDDCHWYESSVELLARIEAGEFGESSDDD